MTMSTYIQDWPLACERFDFKRGHILNYTSLERPAGEVLQTQKPKMTTKDGLKRKLPNKKCE